MQPPPAIPRPSPDVHDFIVIGSGFGGSVSAMRLAEKGYTVLVLERGKRYRDQDFARTNWNIWKYLWFPALRCYGILQMSFLNGVLILHGSGVGGGSLGYANVLMEPDARLFENPSWKHLADWKAVLRPHYATARRMLGVARNPNLTSADHVLKDIADEMGVGDTFQSVDVGVFFNDPGLEGRTVPDPYFGGDGPERAGCIQCGGCMVGCRHNAKNTLVKNYLYFAEKLGAQVRPEIRVLDIQPLPPGQPDGARYQIVYQKSTSWLLNPPRRVRARNVVVSAGVLGTLKLLLSSRDITRSLTDLSPRLGEMVRTNSEAIIGTTTRDRTADYSKGVAITSYFQADEVTAIEPVRYPEGSGFIRNLAFPMINVDEQAGFFQRLLKSLWMILTHPLDFLYTKVTAPWAKLTTIILVMQTEDNLMRLRLGRDLFTLFRRGLVPDRGTSRPVPTRIPIGEQVTHEFARRTDGVSATSFTDSLFNFPTTAHVMGGVPFGRDASEGVIGLDCQAHNYPGLYVVDGSIMPANPGINPSLTITALAEYAMSHIPQNDTPHG